MFVLLRRMVCLAKVRVVPQSMVGLSPFQNFCGQVCIAHVMNVYESKKNFCLNDMNRLFDSFDGTETS